MAGIIITQNSEEETKPQRSLLTYLPEITLLISGERGLETRFSTLTSSTLIIIYFFGTRYCILRIQNIAITIECHTTPPL